VVRAAASVFVLGSTGLHLPSLHATHLPLVHEREEVTIPPAPMMLLLLVLVLPSPVVLLLLLLC
jgi:hypothetical protein